MLDVIHLCQRRQDWYREYAEKAVLVPVEFAMFFLVQGGQVRVWMCMPYMLALGAGGLVNMTAQRPLIYEIAGPRLAPAAMAIEATAQAGSSMIGTLVGGLLISHLGMAAGFAGMAVLLCVSLILLRRVPAPARPAAGRAGSHAVRAQLAACAALVHGSQRLRRLEKYSDHSLVALGFAEVAFTGRRARFFAAMEKIASPPGLERIEKIPTPHVLSVGTLSVPGARLPEGLRLIWKTMPYGQESSPRRDDPAPQSSEPLRPR